MHPVEDIRGKKSNKLAGKKIVLGVCGSIAAVEDVRLARELIRHGAEVIPVMSGSATGIIHPYALEFATGNRPITDITGAVEHVSLCGAVPDRADLLLVAPATANTISKMATGIDDTPVTTFATTALGTGIPVVAVPAMHGTMYDHAVVLANIRKLEDLGVVFVGPLMAESKAKMARWDQIISTVIRIAGKRELEGKRMLVIGGGTQESIDNMRLITNKATGRTGIALAQAAYQRGALVTLWMGHGHFDPPSYLTVEDFSTVDELLKKAKGKERFDIIIMSAAVGDYAPVPHQGKIPSGKESIKLELKPLPKVITQLRKTHKKAFIVGFKAESGLKWNDLIGRGRKLMEREDLQMVVVNDIEMITPEENHIAVVFPAGPPGKKSGSKDVLAEFLLDCMGECLSRR